MLLNAFANLMMLANIASTADYLSINIVAGSMQLSLSIASWDHCIYRNFQE